MSENLRKQQVNSLFLPAYTKDLNLVLCFMFFQTHASTVGCRVWIFFFCCCWFCFVFGGVCMCVIKGSTKSTPDFKLWALNCDNFWNTLWTVTTKRMMTFPPAKPSSNPSLGYKQTWTWGSDSVFSLLHTSQSCSKPAWLATSVTGTKCQKRRIVCKGQWNGLRKGKEMAKDGAGAVGGM